MMDPAQKFVLICVFAGIIAICIAAIILILCEK